ncbi:ROK family transcriptional regulator [Clostridium oryzae]|uniref:N-acetylglucosamine repressor n=1 Tax=Clostridium oryzae TaxID=1450648 RepID=A0A1V4ICN5_9CLOT|nr:ROK family transcriptional regulator [Clostridium oryzae]OPJ57768.1 N-acetylglucosamine repressor [Clostridium oryzae]
MVALDASNIKLNNRKRIIKLLSVEREVTKLDISRKLDISVPTVSTIILELIKEGIVEEAGMASSTGGRKPVIIKFLPNSRYSIGVNLDSGSVKAVLTNLDGDIICRLDKELMDISETCVLKTMKELIETLMSKCDKDKQCMGVGFSLPGTIDEKNMRLDFAANFKLNNLAFKDLQADFNVPMYLENEANAGALAEWQLGLAKDKNNVIYISISQGVGGGFIIDKKMYKGSERRAGEIGHMTINKNGRACNCGKKGCWETYASQRALISDYNQLTKKNVRHLEDVVRAYRNNEVPAQQVLKNYIEDLAEGIKNLMFIFNPDYIIIGGEISRYSDIFSSALIEKVFDNNVFYKKEDVNILFSSLDGDANILGAAIIPIVEGFGFTDI